MLCFKLFQIPFEEYFKSEELRFCIYILGRSYNFI